MIAVTVIAFVIISLENYPYLFSHVTFLYTSLIRTVSFLICGLVALPPPQVMLMNENCELEDKTVSNKDKDFCG